jgi:hypothetical protein
VEKNKMGLIFQQKIILDFSEKNVRLAENVSTRTGNYFLVVCKL